MSVDESKMNEALPSKKSFFDYIREGWGSLKDFIVEKFSAIKETLSSLNILKRDVASNDDPDRNKDSVENNDKNLREKLLEIVARSRKPWDVCKNDEWSVSLWILQRHWSNAVDLLERLRQVNQSRFDSIMTDPLFKDLDKAWMAIWNDEQTQQYKELIKDSRCVQVMRDKAFETVDSYLRLISGWGVTDARATLAWWRICNAWSWFAQNIKNDMKRKWKNINDYSQVIAAYKSTDFWRAHNKFWKRYACFDNKNLEEVIGEYRA